MHVRVSTYIYGRILETFTVICKLLSQYTTLVGLHLLPGMLIHDRPNAGQTLHRLMQPPSTTAITEPEISFSNRPNEWYLYRRKLTLLTQQEVHRPTVVFVLDQRLTQ